MHTATHCNSLQLTPWLCDTQRHSAADSQQMTSELQDPIGLRHHCEAAVHTATICIAKPCDTLQLYATLLQHATPHCNTSLMLQDMCTLQRTAPHCTALQCTATHCNTLHHAATHCNTPLMLQDRCASFHTASHCNTLQHTATHCNTLQHAATHRRLP